MKINESNKSTDNSLHRILALDLGYEREEINEPLGIDIVVSDIKRQFNKHVEVITKYCEYQSNEKLILDSYELILISTKITSYAQLCYIVESATVPTIIGGALATYEPEYLARRFPHSVISIGESETNINSIISIYLSTLESGLFFQKLAQSNIRNICFMLYNKLHISKRDSADLIKCKTPNHEKVDDILKSNGLIRMETSRGCPWNRCTFCVMPWRFNGRKWSHFSYEKIETELQMLVSHGVKQIYFTDEDFIGCEEHILKLCNIIRKCAVSEFRITFGGSTSVKTLLSLEPKLDYYIDLMKASGIYTFFLGIESGSDHQLLRYNKGVTVADNLNIIKRMKDNDMIIDPGFIMFDAETTMEELHENLLFIKQSGFEDNIGHYTKKIIVVAHTEIYNRYAKLGLIIPELDPNTCSYDYTFQDETINLLWSYLDKIDRYIMREAYHLQFHYRSAATKQEKLLYCDKLVELRKKEYQFLCECDTQYRIYGELDALYLQKLTSQYLNYI